MFNKCCAWIITREIRKLLVSPLRKYSHRRPWLSQCLLEGAQIVGPQIPCKVFRNDSTKIGVYNRCVNTSFIKIGEPHGLTLRITLVQDVQDLPERYLTPQGIVFILIRATGVPNAARQCLARPGRYPVFLEQCIHRTSIYRRTQFRLVCHAYISPHESVPPNSTQANCCLGL